MSDEEVHGPYTILTSPRKWVCFKIDTRIELKAKKHWEVVSGNTPRPQKSSFISPSSTADDRLQASASMSPHSKQKDWDNHNRRALAIIFSRLGPKYKAQYDSVTTASALWKALCSQHETSMRRFDLIVEIARITIADCNNDINVYGDKFLCLRGEQILVNGDDHQEDNYTENQLVAFYIGGLQSSPRWRPFALNLLQKEKFPSSLDMIVQRSREEQRFRSMQKRLAKMQA